MYSKTSFVFLVILALAQGIVIDEPTDQSQNDTSVNLYKSRLMSYIVSMSFLLRIVPLPVLKFLLNVGLPMLVFIASSLVSISIFKCFSKDYVSTCKERVARLSRMYMTPENIEMTAKFVQRALEFYEVVSHSSEPISIEERKDEKFHAVKSRDDVEQIVPNEEDNETQSYI